jgi:hypothetical protein
MTIMKWVDGEQVPMTDEDQAQQEIDAAIPPSPDAEGFAQAVKAGVGGIVAANALATSYPLFFAAVQAQQWADVQALILDAQAKGVLNSGQYAAFKAAAEQFHVPVTLP